MLTVPGRLRSNAELNNEAKRTLLLNFKNTRAHPMGYGYETIETITLAENGVDRARTMQHFKHGVLEQVTSVFGII